MPRILTTCPNTGQPVPTGYRSADVDLADETSSRSFRCPVCQKVHAWTPREATVEETARFVA